MDATREKFVRLMAEIEDLEERVEDLEREGEVAAESPNPRDAAIVEQELHDLSEELAGKRNELARISNGCSTPRPQS